MVKKKLLGGLFCLVGLAMLGMFLVPMTGCSTTSRDVSVTVGDTTTIGTSDATLSGTLSYGSGVVTVNLNSVLVSGDAITLTSGKLRVRVGTSLTSVSTSSAVTFTLPSVTDRPMDMVFILDNTGSMSSRIVAVKDSIAAFAATLEAAGTDVKFGIVSFGDTTSESSSLALPSTAAQVSTWLASLEGVGGGDSPENPLTAVMQAYNNFTWRSTAQKVFIVITDNPCHQVGDGTDYTAYTVAQVETVLRGKATVYAVSPKINAYSTYPRTFSVATTTEGDVRWLADGYGWYYGITNTASYESSKPYLGTGGKWVELPSSGNIDLTTLGIATTVASGATIRFDYTFSAGTYYVLIQVDTNGDGVFDSNMVVTLSVAAGANSAFSTFGTQPVVQQVIDKKPVEGVKVGAPN